MSKLKDFIHCTVVLTGVRSPNSANPTMRTSLVRSPYSIQASPFQMLHIIYMFMHSNKMWLCHADMESTLQMHSTHNIR